MATSYSIRGAAKKTMTAPKSFSLPKACKNQNISLHLINLRSENRKNQTSLRFINRRQNVGIQGSHFSFWAELSHSSVIRGLCSTLCSRETLQNLPYFCNKKTNVFFSVFSFCATLYFYLMNALVYVDTSLGH